MAVGVLPRLSIPRLQALARMARCASQQNWRPMALRCKGMILCPRGTAWGRHETSPPQILASGSGRCLDCGRVAHHGGASLSVAAGADHRPVSRRPSQRHRRAAHGSIAVGAARQPFVIENRTGAGGNIGTESVVRATPDGHTLLLMGLSNAMNATLYNKLNFNFIREIAPVASIGGAPYVMVINPSVPAKTVPEFIAYAKANPGKINIGSSGSGSVSHVFGERFKMMTGINLVHVPYRGGYVPDLLSGQVQVVFGTISSRIQYIRGGMLRALAVTTTTRSDVLPDIPTLAEFVPGYEA